MAILPEPREPFRRRLVNVKLTNCVKDWVAGKQLAECVTPHLKILYKTLTIFLHYCKIFFKAMQIYRNILQSFVFVAPHLKILYSLTRSQSVEKFAFYTF